MLRDKIFRHKLHATFIDAGVSGVIHDHDDEGNRHAIRRMLSGDEYYDFGIKLVRRAEHKHLKESAVTEIVAASLGIDVERFHQDGPGYINPDLTIERLADMLSLVDHAIAKKQTILLGTGHPGSMIQFYVRLANYIERQGGKLYQLPQSLKIHKNYWVDSACGVLVVSDLGSLLHTHDFTPLETVLNKLKPKVGLVVADHGFAGAAVNAKIKTVGLHDVDDPGIPMAKTLGADLLCVPMNDNQLNLSTDRALAALMTARQSHE